jgi:hypothetical protein
MDDLPGAARSALIGSMTPSEHLTRRPDPHRRDCWLIYCADTHVGTIALAVGVPGAQRWTWHCVFYPGGLPGEYRSGSAPTFEKARAQFERAWKVFALADYQEWRDQRDWAALKYFLRDRSLRVPLR